MNAENPLTRMGNECLDCDCINKLTADTVIDLGKINLTVLSIFGRFELCTDS